MITHGFANIVLQFLSVRLDNSLKTLQIQFVDDTLIIVIQILLALSSVVVQGCRLEAFSNAFFLKL